MTEVKSVERIMVGLRSAVGADPDETYTLEEMLESIARETGYRVVPRGAYVPESPADGIYAALIDAMRRVGAVGKLGEYRERQDGPVQYRFRGVDAVINAVGPALREAGIVPIPHVDTIERTPGTTKGGGPKTTVIARVTYRFTAADGSFVPVTVEGEANDTSDKGTGKAMSVAYRIALLQLFAIPTDDPDPDAVRIEGGQAAAMSAALVEFIRAEVNSGPLAQLEKLWWLVLAHVQADSRVPDDPNGTVWWEEFALRYRHEVATAPGIPGLNELWKTIGQFGRTFRIGAEGDVGALIKAEGMRLKAEAAEAHAQAQEVIERAADGEALDAAVVLIESHRTAHVITEADKETLLQLVANKRTLLANVADTIKGNLDSWHSDAGLHDGTPTSTDHATENGGQE
jgi:hypothetical protein